MADGRGVWVVLLLLALAVAAGGCSPAARRQPPPTLNVRGSDTMLHLARVWAEAYAAVDREVQVAVAGGGSGVGIAGLLDGAVDVALASRPLSAEEQAAAAARGLAFSEAVVGLDAIAVVVHPDNYLGDLSLAELRSLFTGRITRWSALGGPNVAVTVVSRPSGSGTARYFQAVVLGRHEFTPRAMQLPSSQAVAEAVAAAPGGIGYLDLVHARAGGDRIKILGLALLPGGEPVLPSAAAVRQGRYPLSRPLYLYTRSDDDRAARFVAFARSSEGQQLLTQAGYIAVR